MAFDLDTWKERAAGQMADIKSWWERARPGAAHAVYSALCAATLWPVVEAAQAGDVVPAVAAMLGVAGGVGGNLLAEQVICWRDKAEAAAWMDQHASDRAVRQALEAVLAELNAERQAAASLTANDRAWLKLQLRVERERLGSPPSDSATVIGGGAIGQGTGNIVLGQGATYSSGNVTIEHHHGPSTERSISDDRGSEQTHPVADQVRKLVERDRLEEALRVLVGVARCEDEATLHLSQLTGLRRRERLGLITMEEARVVRGRIALSALEMCRG